MITVAWFRGRSLETAPPSKQPRRERDRGRRHRGMFVGPDAPRAELLEARLLLVGNAPLVNTNAATNVTTSSAKANAEINSEDTDTTVTLVFGTNPTLTGNTTQSNHLPLVPAQTDQIVFGSMFGLTPDTTYYYEFVATNAGGTTVGTILNFTTLPGPPVVSGQSASNILDTTGTFSATVSPAGNDTTVRFDYGTDPNLVTGTTSTASQDIGSGSTAVTASKNVTGLSPGTKYYVHVVATNAAGTTSGTIFSFITGGQALNPPNVTAESATSVTTTTATLKGTVNPNGVDTTVTDTYGTDPTLASGVTSIPVDIGAGTTDVTGSDHQTGLTPNTKYYYQFTATNAGGTTKGQILSFTTLAAPPVATTSAATAVTSTSATINGSVNPEADDTMVSFVFGADPNLTTGTITTAAQDIGAGSSAANVSASQLNLSPSTTYYYQVVATNSAGKTQGQILSFTTAAVLADAQTGNATLVTAQSALLNGSVNPLGADTTVHFVYGADPNLATGTMSTATQDIGSGTAPVAVTDSLSGLTPGTTYYYEVVATNKAGTSRGEILSFTTSTQVAVPPLAVTDPNAVAGSYRATVFGEVNPEGSSANAYIQYSTDPSLPPTFVTHLAGSSNNHGSADGTGAAAQFYNPSDVAVDSAGNVYVADWYNDTIRKITPEGAVTTLAGSPGVAANVDGKGSAARFVGPIALAVDRFGNIFVVSVNDTVRVVTPDGVVTTLAGSPSVGGYADGVGGAAKFDQPKGIAVDAFDNIFVADYNNRAIREVTLDGTVTTVAGGPSPPLPNPSPLIYPDDVAVGPDGNLYVADASVSGRVMKVTLGGVVTTVAGTINGIGGADGPVGSAQFDGPTKVVVDGAGNIYVSDPGDESIREISGGVVTTLVGPPPGAFNSQLAGTRDGIGDVARFQAPVALALDPTGGLYVVDEPAQVIRKLTAPNVLAASSLTGGSYLAVDATLTGLLPDTTYYYRVVADNAGGTGAGVIFSFHTARAPAPPAIATTQPPTALTSASATLNATVNPGGNATDTEFQYSTDPNLGYNVTTFAGSGAIGDVDGTGTSASFWDPYGIAIDHLGNLYVADWSGQVIRKITPARVVTTIAGQEEATGNVNGPGSQARFNFPTAIAVDSQNNVYVADSGNGEVRKIAPDGMVSTLAGAVVPGGSQGSDNVGTYAAFGGITALAVDAADNVYAGDGRSVRKITPAGLVTTLAGPSPSAGKYVGSAGEVGFGFTYPSQLAVDAAGNVYVADAENGTIRKIAGDGTVTSLGTPINPASDPYLGGVAIDVGGDIILVDHSNSVVQRMTPSGSLITLAGSGNLGYQNGTGANAVFRGPWNVVAAPDGTFYVTDAGNDVIRKLTLATLAAASGLTGTSNLADSASLTGLSPGTTYYYRVVAASAGGSTYGAIQSFTTAAPPVATTGPAIAVTTSTATLNSSINPGGFDTAVTFTYGTDPNLATGTMTTSPHDAGSGGVLTGVTAALTGLSPNTTYYFQVQATSVGGVTLGAIQSFTTATLANSPPAATSQAPLSVSSTGATLNAIVNPEGLATTASFTYGTDPNLVGGTTTTVQSIGSGTSDVTVTQAVSGLTPSTTYFFRVSATNSAGTTNGAILSFTTQAPALGKPSATTLAADSFTNTTATLHGTANPNGSATNVDFVFGTDPNLPPGTGTTSVLAIGSGTSTIGVTGSLNGLTPGTTYYFQLVATNAQGTTKGAILNFTTTGPAPSPPAATSQAPLSVSSTGATLNALVNPEGLAATASFTYGTDPNLVGGATTSVQAIGSGTSDVTVTQAVSGLTPSTTYYFRVSATNSAGTTNGAILSFTTKAASNPLVITSTTPSNGAFVTALPGGQFTINFNHTLAGLSDGGPGFPANDPYAIFMLQRGPGLAFGAPDGFDGGTLPLHANTIYHDNGNGTSRITVTPLEPLSSDLYGVSINLSDYQDLAGNTPTDPTGGPPGFHNFLLQHPPTTGAPLRITGVTSYNGFAAINNNAVFPPDTLAIAFNKPLWQGAASGNNVQLLAFNNSNYSVQPSVATYSPSTNTIYLTPTGLLFPGTIYIIRVDGSVSDDQGFSGPGGTLGQTYYNTFSVYIGPASDQPPFQVPNDAHGHPETQPVGNLIWSLPVGYARVQMTETLDMTQLGRFSVMLDARTAGSDNNQALTNIPLNAKLAFNPNTNQLIVVPTQLQANDVYVFILSGLQAQSGDVLSNAQGQPMPVYFTSYLLQAPVSALALASSVIHATAVSEGPAIVAPLTAAGAPATPSGPAPSFRAARARRRAPAAIPPRVTALFIPKGRRDAHPASRWPAGPLGSY